MDFYDILMVIVIGLLALGCICFIAWVVWAIWFECTRTIEPKSISNSHCTDGCDDWDDYYGIKSDTFMDQHRSFQRELERQDMENHDRIASDYLSYAEFDYEMGVYMHEQACDLAQHDHDSHNDMFNDVGCANPFF